MSSPSSKANRVAGGTASPDGYNDRAYSEGRATDSGSRSTGDTSSSGKESIETDAKMHFGADDSDVKSDSQKHTTPSEGMSGKSVSIANDAQSQSNYSSGKSAAGSKFLQGKELSLFPEADAMPDVQSEGQPLDESAENPKVDDTIRVEADINVMRVAYLSTIRNPVGRKAGSLLQSIDDPILEVLQSHLTRNILRLFQGSTKRFISCLTALGCLIEHPPMIPTTCIPSMFPLRGLCLW
jgi:hypothetical protein